MINIRPWKIRILKGFMILASFQSLGCLELNDSHCLARGGDFACISQVCLLQIGPDQGSTTDEIGCSDQGYDTGLHIRVKYGLPAGLDFNDSLDDLDTLQGVMGTVREDNGFEGHCSLHDPDLEIEFDAVKASHKRIQDLREHIDKRRLALKYAEIGQEENVWVEDFNAKVGIWSDACRALITPE